MSDHSGFITIVTFVVIIGIIIGGVGYAVSPAWSETGHVTWVGQKSFSDGNWNTPYAVTTQSHGIMNFTTSKVPIVQFDNSSTHIAPSLGLLVGVEKLNGLPGISGQMKVVSDP